MSRDLRTNFWHIAYLLGYLTLFRRITKKLLHWIEGASLEVPAIDV